MIAWLRRLLRRLIHRLRQPLTPDEYRRVTGVALALLALIVVTGAAVRLTGSGLGCEDWPTCSSSHPSPVSATSVHAGIESGNRALTGLVSVAVAVAVLGSMRRAPRRADLVWLSWGLVAGVMAQIYLGGQVVEHELNPWLVQGHFVLSMLLVLDAVVLHHRAGLPDGVAVRPVVTPALLRWGRALAGWAAVVLLTGTLVTGAGPHSGQARDGVQPKRLPLTPHDAARLHGFTAMVLVGMAVWVLVQLRRHHHDNEVLRVRSTLLLTVLALQGALGYTQYFTGVPPLLVGLHVLGATLVWITALQLALAMRAPVEEQALGVAASMGGNERADLVAPRGS